MSRINQIKKALLLEGVKVYEITEIENKSYQQFYVKGDLETLREVKTLEDLVSVYVPQDDNKFIGKASFLISHKSSNRELSDLIKDALYQASFVKNPYYELVKGEKSKSVSYKPLDEKPMEILENIAKIYKGFSTDEYRFNSLELFFDENEVKLVNSNGVNYKKKTFEIKVEAIPSFYSSSYKTELYRFFEYETLDYNKIKEDALSGITDLANRGKAIKLDKKLKVNVILHDKDIKELFSEFISTFNYRDVYSKQNLKSLNDMVQENPKTKLNLSLDKSSKANFFDRDGVLLKKTDIIKDGKLVSYFGDFVYASYLGVEPTGALSKLVLKKGSRSVEDLKKKPYIEIFDLSGIQADSYAGYLGGEIRLAIYFDGENTYPVTGISFSTSLDQAINNIMLSKETSVVNGYEGPKFALLSKVDVI